MSSGAEPVRIGEPAPAAPGWECSTRVSDAVLAQIAATAARKPE